LFQNLSKNQTWLMG